MALKRLGRYQLTKLLWHGRNAEVYLAQDSKTKMLVVIKLLHESFSDQQTDQQMRQKFLREAENLRLLDHPNIVHLIETNFDQGIRPYFVMAYALGGTLREKYSQDIPLSLETIRSYLRQLAGALSYAHNHGIIHCDVKPTNVLLDKDGHLLLSDFGIARLSESTLPQATRDPFGTPIYMAPEQFKGKWDARTDQYALAVMVYEWFCGHPPFSGENRNQIMDYHLTMPVPSLQDACARYKDTISDSILRKVEQILLKALAKEPSGRFPSMEEFAQALEQVLQPPILIVLDVPSVVSSREGLSLAETLSKDQQGNANLEQSLQGKATMDATENILASTNRPIRTFYTTLYSEVQFASELASVVHSMPIASPDASRYHTDRGWDWWIRRIVGISLIAAGIVTSPLETISAIHTQAFNDTALITQGTVKNSSEETVCGVGSASGCTTSCVTEISFVPSGQKKPFTISDLICSALEKGDKVKVYYDPHNPETAKTSRQASSDTWWTTFGIIFWPIMTLIGMIVIVWEQIVMFFDDFFC